MLKFLNIFFLSIFLLNGLFVKNDALASPLVCNLERRLVIPFEPTWTRFLKHPKPKQAMPYDSVETLKVMSYNVLNLSKHVGEYVRDSMGNLRPLRGEPPRVKASKFLREQSDIVLRENPDILLLQEIESFKTLNAWNKQFLQDRYRVFLREGNDTRGIQVAIMLKRDLPFDVTHYSFKELRLPGSDKPQFSRDVPVIGLHRFGQREPLLAFGGVHLKSKRDSPGDPESKLRRASEIGALRRVFAYFDLHSIPLSLSGDFNGDLVDGPEFKPLWSCGLRESISLLPPERWPSERVTHSYFPKGESPQYHQMDGHVLSPELAERLKDVHIVRYLNPDGSVRPLPPDYETRKTQASDHFPIMMEVRLK